MKLAGIFLILNICSAVFAGPVLVDGALTRKPVGKNCEFLVDREEDLTVRQLIAYDDLAIKKEHEKLSSEEIEAHLLAQQIVEDIASKRKIYDLKQKRFRKIDYQDITILVDRKKNFSTYAKILSYYACNTFISSIFKITFKFKSKSKL